MPDWFSRLRDLVWPAVLAAVLAGASVIAAFLASERPVLALSLGLAAVTMGLLATRE
jgi:hypothetical protein